MLYVSTSSQATLGFWPPVDMKKLCWQLKNHIWRKPNLNKRWGNFSVMSIHRTIAGYIQLPPPQKKKTTYVKSYDLQDTQLNFEIDEKSKPDQQPN